MDQTNRVYKNQMPLLINAALTTAVFRVFFIKKTIINDVFKPRLF